MLSPAGSLTVMSFGSGACGAAGSKLVSGLVGSFVCGKVKSTPRPVGWSAWTAPPPSASALVSRLGFELEGEGRFAAAGHRRSGDAGRDPVGIGQVGLAGGQEGAGVFPGVSVEAPFRFGIGAVDRIGQEGGVRAAGSMFGRDPVEGGVEARHDFLRQVQGADRQAVGFGPRQRYHREQRHGALTTLNANCAG